MAAKKPTKTTKAPKRRKLANALAQEKAPKLSAVEAAAKVLAEEGRPMHGRELIEVMAGRGYWTSPAGRTPAATLYAALLRLIQTQGAACRFRKVDRGQFALKS